MDYLLNLESDVNATVQAKSEIQVVGLDKDKSEISCGDNIATIGEENLLSENGQVSSNADKEFESSYNTST